MPKTFQELMEAIMKILPDAELAEDLDGQVVIYSGLEEKPNGRLEKLSPPDDPDHTWVEKTGHWKND